MFTRRAWLTLTTLLSLEGSSFAQTGSSKGSGSSRAENAPTLLLVPLGNSLLDADIEFVKTCLLAFYDFNIELYPRTKLPPTAYYPPRQRYRAEKLLSYLDRLANPSYNRVVGLTGVDISTTKGDVFDWGVLGLATIDGRVGVLSSHRCERGTKNHRELAIRFGKVAVHEVGHTLGLPHCPTLRCLMEDAKGSVMTTDREYDLCPACRNRLTQSGHGARENPEIPWPKPTVE